jgi:hypothetical protein
MACACRTGKGADACPNAAAVLVEKIRLLRDACTNKYLLLPAIFFFLWQVRPHGPSYTRQLILF